jgi:uncharacterized phage-associated protein
VNLVTTPYSAATIAKWFLAWSEHLANEGISNLKLQKLLYYAQGHHLAAFKKPLFSDTIEAWSHGPVVPDVYHEYKAYGGQNIQLDPGDAFVWDDVDVDTADYLVRVWNTYGQFSAWKLRDMTHDETPWQEYFTGAKRVEIPHEALVKHFEPRTQVD